MNHKKVNNNPRPLNLGVLPPWQLTVTLADGEKRLIKIPYSDGTHVLGLPLGSDVPEVVAKNYKTLLCMVNGMTSVISDLTRKLDRQQQDAARHLDDANCFRLELQLLKCKIDGGMVVPPEALAPMSPSKKRKLSREESDPCKIRAVSINGLEHSPPPRSSDTSAIPVPLVLESVTEDNVDDLPLTSVKHAGLYKKIISKYGLMATKKVIKFNDAILLACVTSLLKIASKMETVRGMDLSVVLVESWEGEIQDAETLQFNIGWLHEKFDRLKNSWKSSFKIDEDLESLKQVLDAAQMGYVDLYSRKDKLEAELTEVKASITESGALISSQREAIREKLAQRNTFMLEPVLGNLFRDWRLQIDWKMPRSMLVKLSGMETRLCTNLL